MPSGLSAACSLSASPQRASARDRAAAGCRIRHLARHPCCLRAGFSLVELMVVLAIATILAVVTVPSYRDHVMRSRIPEATSGLLLTGMRLEQYYQDHRSYANLTTAACGVTLPGVGQFAFDCTVPADGQSFLLSAIGRGDGAMAGFGYTLDHLGVQRTTALPGDWGNAPANCWIEKRRAGC